MCLAHRIDYVLITRGIDKWNTEGRKPCNMGYLTCFVNAPVLIHADIKRLDKEWERKMMRKFTGRNERVKSIESTDSEPLSTEDYTEELLRDKPEKEPANLSDYRTLKKPWEDKDLV